MFNPAAWKPSAYNLLLQGRDGQVLFNSSSGQSLWLDEDRRAVIDGCLKGLGTNAPDSPPAPLVEGLATLGFVVEAGKDEFAAERERYMGHRDDRRKLYITIAPTLQCNMRCSYCFQQNVAKVKPMTADIQRGVVEFIRRRSESAEALVLQWFGGEPLLAWPLIEDMTAQVLEHCAAKGIRYHGELLTNGLLLTPGMVAALPRLGIRAIQLPLDGSAKTYSERRHLPLDKAERYYRFLVENLPQIAEHTGNVIIRINIDRENLEEARQVVMMFKNAGVVDQRIDFRLGFLNTSRGMVECIPHDCLTTNEFAEFENEFRRFLGEQGYRVFGMPQPVNYPCTAVLRNNFTIDPKGNIGKCVPATGSGQCDFARIHPEDMDRTMAEVEQARHPYNDFDPFARKGCAECPLLPSCLGSCPKDLAQGGKYACGIKEALDDKLAFFGSYHHRRHQEQA
ncbi:MAG TPA: radical SAM protein [Candidatus Sulfotelmatobacter sp.]|jgi:uncharacterized protein|nr:radical SAM protein [Candidatus Sulfotelmatobacter sp.]